MNYVVFFFSSLAAVLSLFPGAAVAQSSGKDCRLALLIAHNRSGGRARRLRYAISDAQKMKTVLAQTAGYKPSNLFLLANQPASVVRKKLHVIEGKMKVMKRNGCKVTLLIYYSGHARNGQFFLGSSSLSFRELRLFLKRSSATLRLAFLDTCGSGRFLQMRGLVRQKKSFRIPALHTHITKGEAIITSTGTRENAYEDFKLKGGIFTHFMVTGLRGAADHNGDGRVTLNELYAYTYNWTLNRTVFAPSGPQKPHFQTNLKGSGHVVLSTTSRIHTRLEFSAKVVGQFFIWNANQTLYAGFRKKRGQVLTLAMSPGLYRIQWRHKKQTFTAKISLKRRRLLRLGLKQRRLAYTTQQLSTRGGATKNAQEAATWQLIEGLEPPRTWELFFQSGVRGAELVGGPAWGGAALGIRHRFMAWRVGLWGTSVGGYQTGPQEHLYLTTRFDGGYSHQWGRLTLFAGGYGGVGLLVQDVATQGRLGLIMQAGASVVPGWNITRRWGIALQVDVGLEASQFGDLWRAYPAWSGVLELRYAI